MKRFLALSRVSHGILDIATPGFCALLWLGHFPQGGVLGLSILTAFAAYTAIYALNDLIGYVVDREKFTEGINAGYSVEASALRYPLARNLLTFREGLIWFAVWFVVAVVGSFVLNPVIVLILIGAGLLEIAYCSLLKVTYLRFLVSGVVKSSGPIAAVFVVNRSPSPWLLLLVFAWVFFWEIGGQNIPADWNDTEEDRRVNAKTIPIRFGTRKSGVIVLISLGLAIAVSLFLPIISPIPLGAPYLIASAAAGLLLLLRPAFRLFRLQEGRLAAKLFDNASYYPLAQLLIISAFVLIR